MSDIVKQNIPTSQSTSAINREFNRVKGVDTKQDIRLTKLEKDMTTKLSSSSTILSDKVGKSFETVSKNLKGWGVEYSYSGDLLSSIVYSSGSETITKSFNYTGDVLDSIVLSGDVPNGIKLTKTFNYLGEVLDNIVYS